MTFRFIHTADIHLDSPLKSLALRNAALAQLISNASRQVLSHIVDLCIDEHVDALLIAGDLYDGNQTSMKTARFLAEQMQRLEQAEIRVFIIRGNHDALSTITKELMLPENVHLFGGRAEAVAVEREAGCTPVYIHGVSFSQSHAPESLLPKYKSIVANAINIGLMHTSLDGAIGHDPYAPCKLTDLQQSGFDYWALGHIHKQQVYRVDDTDSGAAVVMAGIPQGRDIGEDGPKSVSLVEIDDQNRVCITNCATALAQFELLEFSITGQTERGQLVEELVIALSQLREACSAEHLVARIVLSGHSSLSWLLHRDPDLLLEDIDVRAGTDRGIWIDKLVLNCTAASVHSDAGVDLSSPVDELGQLVSREIAEAEDYLDDAVALVRELQRLLPAEVRNEFGSDEDTLQHVTRSLAQEGAQKVLAHLRLQTVGTQE